MRIVSEGVKKKHFLKTFQGKVKGSSYHVSRPPSTRIENFRICEQFRSFVTIPLSNGFPVGAYGLGQG